MPAGIQIINDSSITQIDDTSTVLAFVGKYSAILSKPYQDSTHGECYLEFNARDKVVAYVCDNWAVISGYDVWGRPLVSGFLGHQVTAYVFSKPTSSSSASFEVYRESGELAFTSGQRPLKVAGVASVNTKASVQGGGVPVTTGIGLPYGNWAVIVPTQMKAANMFGLPQGAFSFYNLGYQSAFLTSTTGVWCADEMPQHWPLSFPGWGEPLSASSPGQMIAVNVAGL